MQNKTKEHSVLQNNRGLSLIEVIIALVILLFIFIGLVQTSLVAIENNMINSLRDEGVRITSDTLARVRAETFDDMNDNGTNDNTDGWPLVFNLNTNRDFRNVTVPYTVEVTITSLGADYRQISIITQWEWKDRTIGGGDPYEHQIVSTRRRI
jgi:prepilin-type N-terminal cleavage/methylation domain-containing protein